jgi:hypothetical protein
MRASVGFAGLLALGLSSPALAEKVLLDPPNRVLEWRTNKENGRDVAYLRFPGNRWYRLTFTQACGAIHSAPVIQFQTMPGPRLLGPGDSLLLPDDYSCRIRTLNGVDADVVETLMR